MICMLRMQTFRSFVGMKFMKDVYSITKSILPLNNGNIIQAGIICKKIPFYMRDSQAGGVLLKKLKYFEVMLNIF